MNWLEKILDSLDAKFEEEKGQDDAPAFSVYGESWSPMPYVEYHDRAPARESNRVGPREFGYLAEIDICGWKFVAQKDGSILIETPAVEGVGSLVFVTGDGGRDLLIELLSLADEQPREFNFPVGSINIGHS